MASYLPKMWSADGPISKPDCTSVQYFCVSGRKLLEPNGHNDSHMMVLSPYMADASFHSNIFVILAALFCALISVAGLLSLLRCALRCGRQVTGLDEAGHVTVRLANTGMKKAAVNGLPSFVYGTGSRLPETSSDCPICLGEFAEGDNVRVLPKCSHRFHVECIDKWLQSHSSCPSCRHNLVVYLEEDTTKLTMTSNSPP